MRRFPFVLAATAAGLAGVLAYHTNRPARSATGDGRGSPGPSGASHPSTGTSSTKANSTGTSSTSTTSPKNTAPATTKPPSTAAPSQATKTATGAREQYGYGVLAARVTVKGSSIVNVQVVGLQTAESYSQQLANYAIPQLRREVLAAQSSNISGVSGATYTSQAYETSVQSALDRLHL